jgi:hypothetical protein
MTTSGNLATNDYNVGGDYDTWGTKFVADMAILNKFAGDTHTVSDTTGPVTLTTTQCQNFSILATGSGSTTVDIRVPDSISRFWYVRNDRASGTITVRCAAGGDAITIAAGEKRLVHSDGTDCTDISLTTLAIASVSGLQAALDAKAALASPTFTGTPAGPTAAAGTNTTQIATTAFVKAAIDVVLGGVAAAGDTLAELYALVTDTDLAAIAALTTTAYGRAFLALADQAALVALLPSYARLDSADQTVTGGARVTSLDLGTPTNGSTVTLDPGDRPLQHLTNNVAGFTLAPGSNTGSIVLDITNGASAGTITTSGFTKVTGAFATTNGYKYRCSVTVGNGGSLLSIQALQ